jgi:hypothetical protein
MRMISSLRASWHTVAAVVLGMGLSTGASAAPIVVDYDAAAQGAFLVAPYVEDGVTMSVVTGHYDIFAAGGGGNLANIDAANFGPSKVSFSLGGSPFTLASILFPTGGQTGVLTASDGSVVAIAATGGTQNFNLAGITSFTLAHTSPFLSFDDVTLDTAAAPEPASLLLLGAGLAAVRLSRLRRRRD